MPIGASFTGKGYPLGLVALFLTFPVAYGPAARFLFMTRPWMWGVGLGLCVGGGVVLLSSLRYGLSAPLLILGLVLAIGFGGLGLLAALVRRRTPID